MFFIKIGDVYQFKGRVEGRKEETISRLSVF
ncbi:hypothetical protein GGR09_000507 [Bartonella heixiaziensis]